MKKTLYVDGQVWMEIIISDVERREAAYKAFRADHELDNWLDSDQDIVRRCIDEGSIHGVRVG